MANYPQELGQDAVCQSHTGHMTGLWFLPTRPLRLNNNELYIYIYIAFVGLDNKKTRGYLITYNTGFFLTGRHPPKDSNLGYTDAGVSLPLL